MSSLETIFADPKNLFHHIRNPLFWVKKGKENVIQHLQSKQGTEQLIFAFEQLLVDSDLMRVFSRTLQSFYFRPDTTDPLLVDARLDGMAYILEYLRNDRYKTMERILRLREMQVFLMRCLNSTSSTIIEFAMSMVVFLQVTRKVSFYDEWRTLIDDKFDSIWPNVKATNTYKKMNKSAFMLLGKMVGCKNDVFNSVKTKKPPHVNMGRKCICCGETSKKAHIQLCAGCDVVRYCGMECQRRDHKKHKRFCKAIREMRRKFQ